MGSGTRSKVRVRGGSSVRVDMVVERWKFELDGCVVTNRGHER